MVDLDQCAHATINGCDKERRGWYPHPSSFSPSICLSSCPARCPLPNCFSPTLVHLHLHWHPPGGRPSAGFEVLQETDAALCISLYLFSQSASFPSLLSGDHCFISHTPSSTYLTLSFPLTPARAVSHMLISPRLFSFSSAERGAFCS